MSEVSKKKVICIAIPKDVYDGMKRLAAYSDRSLTAAVTNACRVAIRAADKAVSETIG